MWPSRLAVDEGQKNARSGGWISFIVVVAAAWITCAVGLANALDVSALVRAEREWIDAGAFVMFAEPGGDGGGIDVVSCERLAQSEGVLAAFAVAASNSTVEPANAPGTVTTLTLVSPGIFGFVESPSPVGAAVLATPAAAGPTGLGDGELTTFTSVDAAGAAAAFTAVTRIVDRSDLGPNLEGSFLLPTLLDGVADSCYIRTDAGHVDAVPTYISETLTGHDGKPAVVRTLLSSNTYGLDFATAYGSRILTWAWAAGALALGGMWALVQRTRRARNAIYQTFGAHHRARLIMQFTEWAALTLPGLAWGWAMAIAFAIAAGAEATVMITQITLHAIATWSAASIAVLATALMPVGTLLDALKDRS